MPKEEWGTKRLCPTTGKRFYDLKKTPIVSPFTGEIVDLDTMRRKPVATAAARVATAAPKDDDALVDDIENDDDLIEAEAVEDDDLDDDLLEDDEDDTVSLDELADVSGTEDEA